MVGINIILYWAIPNNGGYTLGDEIEFPITIKPHVTLHFYICYDTDIKLKPDTVYHWKSRDKAPIEEARQLMEADGVIVSQYVLRRNVAKAVLVKVGGLDSKDEKVRQASATEVIDRVLGKPTQNTDITTKGESLNEGRLSDAQRASLVSAVLKQASDQAGGPGADE